MIPAFEYPKDSVVQCKYCVCNACMWVLQLGVQCIVTSWLHELYFLEIFEGKHFLMLFKIIRIIKKQQADKFKDSRNWHAY